MKLFQTHKPSGFHAFVRDASNFFRIRKGVFKVIVLVLISAALVTFCVVFLPQIKGYFLPVETLTIDITHINYQKLAYKRKIAIERDYLLTGKGDYVPVQIRHKDRVFKADMRLKGDLISHLGKNKWSFRIKLKGDHMLWGMKRFSLQNPEERDNLAQWIFHQALKSEGLIALRYKFIKVIVNGKNWGLYALEEHFDKYLIENNERREGPILKLNEDILWEDRYQNDFSHQTDLQDYNALNIEVFKKNNFLEDPSAYKAYIAGMNLLEAFRNRKLAAHDVFDVEKLARYFALADLLGASHATRWHNMRFYYNPVTTRLEPIGYDASSGEMDYLLGSLRVDYFVPDAFNQFLALFFEDEVFFSEYIYQVERMSQKAYLDKFFKGIRSQLVRNQRVLEQNIKGYRFSTDVYYRNQVRIQNILAPVKAVNAHVESVESGTVTLSVGNILSLPVEIDRLEYNDGLLLKPKTRVILKARRGPVPVSYQRVSFYVVPGTLPLELDIDKCRIFYKLLGASEVLVDSIFSWSAPDSRRFHHPVFHGQVPAESFAFIRLDTIGRNFIIKPGVWVAEKDIVIPEGYKLTATGPTSLDLSHNAKIISFSPVSFIGSEENPIIITSSDGTGQGLAVLQAKEPSFLEYVTFDGLSYPNSDAWSLSGAVTFYESPVRIEHCRFLNNKSEDGLNIVRGDFSISESLFGETLSDALDIDFGRGEIIDSFFKNTGNDAIDVSGTFTRLEGVHIQNPGDKGISVGEQSSMDLKDVFIEQGKIGIAAKDFSKITGERVHIRKCFVGIALYQKKAEFGPALAHLKDVSIKETEYPYLIEDESELKINRKRKRTDQDVIEKLKQDIFSP